MNKKYNIRVFTKENIQAGDRIKRRVEELIENSHIIISILTIDYLNECEEEIGSILAYKNKIVVPIILKECMFDDTEFADIVPIRFSDYEEDGFDKFWNSTTEIIKTIYLTRIATNSYDLNQELLPQVFAGVSINSDTKLINIDTITDSSFNVFEDNPSNKIALRVVGESMFPDIMDYDILLCKKVEIVTNEYRRFQKVNIPKLKRHKFYVIETKTQGAMVKKIQINKQNLILVSVNNKLFDVIIVPKEEVISIWEVVTLLRNYDVE